MENLRRENEFLKSDKEVLEMRLNEMNTEIAQLQHSEIVMMEQTQLQKQEIQRLSKKIKQSNAGDKDHIKNSLIQWLFFLSKG